MIIECIALSGFLWLHDPQTHVFVKVNQITIITESYIKFNDRYSYVELKENEQINIINALKNCPKETNTTLENN